MTLNEAYKNRMRSWWAKRQHYENVGPESRDEWWLQAEEERASLLELPQVISSKERGAVELSDCQSIHSGKSNLGGQLATETVGSPSKLETAAWPTLSRADNETLSSNDDEEDEASHGSSLESIDSQESSGVSSQEDASSQTTELATNAIPTDYLLEHIEFLRQKTQPREVELVWALDQRED